jgi:hypothetical protein
MSRLPDFQGDVEAALAPDPDVAYRLAGYRRWKPSTRKAPLAWLVLAWAGGLTLLTVLLIVGVHSWGWR